MNRLFSLLAIVAIFGVLTGCDQNRNDEILSLRKIKFNEGWMFQLAENEQISKDALSDSSWKNVNIPHDWSIEGEIKEDNPSGSQGGFYPCGLGYYRKFFTFDSSWAEKRVLITFDGIMCNSEVWINGHYLGKRPNGYVGITYDLTPHLNTEENILEVKVNNSAQPGSRWYTGSGIYRNVWLKIKNKVAVAENGTYVSAQNINSNSAEIKIETKLENASASSVSVKLVSEIYDPAGVKVAENTIEQKIANDASITVNQAVRVSNPELWSIETPNQYLLVTKVMEGNNLHDKYETKFGIRDIRFEVETGFWLNGENIKVKGVNNHHGAGPVGAAVPDDVQYRRMKILKEMGCNAIRTAHNPFSPEFYDMCDSLGFLVMDEVFDEWIASWPWIKNIKDQGKVKYGYHLHFEEWAETDLKDIIVRDRNHPSIFMWSVGNEIPDQCYPEGPERLKPLMDIVHELDTTRPITCGCCFIHLANPTGFASMLEVTGYNGGGNSVFYERDKEVYPDRKFIATEVPHSYQTRGVYKTISYKRAPKDGLPLPNLTEEEVFPEFHEQYCSSYDNSCVRINARDSWRRTDSLDYIAGEFRWTGFDYLGEAIKGWPARFFSHGIIDVCGFPKDHFYFYQSQWTEEPMVHILPHWTWPGKEGKVIPVWTYSNADQIELFLNGESLGAKSNKGQMNLSWDVPYTPGIIKAVAKNSGVVVAEEIIETASKPASIEVLVDKDILRADGESCAHLEVNILDEEGRFVPYADNLVSFKIHGPVTNIGVDNGDPLDLASTKLNQRKAFNGKCLMIVQSQKTAGEVSIEVSAEGLETNVVVLKTVK